MELYALFELIQHWFATIPAFAGWFFGQFHDWLGAALAGGNPGHTVQPSGGVSPSATPELDSLVLFGTGLLGAGGYALTRFRARRRQT